MLNSLISPLKRFAIWYNEKLVTWKWTTSTISVAAITGGGDYFSQIFIEKQCQDPNKQFKKWWEPNYERTKNMIIYGILFYSPINVFFYFTLNPWYMHKLYPRWFPNAMKGVELGTIKYSLISLFT